VISPEARMMGLPILAAYMWAYGLWLVSWLGPKVGSHLSPVELSQCLSHDDSTINTVPVLSLIYYYYYFIIKNFFVSYSSAFTSVMDINSHHKVWTVLSKTGVIFKHLRSVARCS